jgi:hypothetical protein
VAGLDRGLHAGARVRDRGRGVADRTAVRLRASGESASHVAVRDGGRDGGNGARVRHVARGGDVAVGAVRAGVRRVRGVRAGG